MKTAETREIQEKTELLIVYFAHPVRQSWGLEFVADGVVIPGEILRTTFGDWTLGERGDHCSAKGPALSLKPDVEIDKHIAIATKTGEECLVLRRKSVHGDVLIPIRCINRIERRSAISF